jgi:hypothetical protein
MDNPRQILSWTDEAISIWTTVGIKLQDRLSSDKISEFEKQLEYKFPQDFLDLYQKVNGFKDFDWNEHMFSLWSVDRILKEYQEDNDNNYVGFCDFLINSHSIGFFKTGKGIFKSYDQTQPIACTFEEAIALINSNSDLLY